MLSKEYKIIATALFVSCIIMNGVGIAVDVSSLSDCFDKANLIAAVVSLLIVGVLYYVLRIKRNDPLLFSRAAVITVGFGTFPVLLYTSPDLVFMPYIGILATIYGVLTFKTVAMAVLSFANILLLTTIIFVKISWGINIDTVFFDRNAVHFLAGIPAGYVGIMVFTSIISYSLLRRAEENKLAAITDGLTKAWTRPILNDLTINGNDSIVMLDIDNFKKLNDAYGHANGDKSLVFLVSAIKRHLKKGDHLIRYGGEEFIIILWKCSIQNAVKVAERIRSTVENESKEEPSIAQPFTVSIGVAGYDSKLSKDENIKIVDAYLYNSKHNGKNMVSSELDTARSPS